jgi:2,4-dienoyl-CoA reductase-like NADH-dependent reductase (Old Yellow Enzyme family)
MSALFSKFKMRDLELDNRIVVSPMGQYSGDNGSATDWHMMHLGHLAVSGAGLLITEATAVNPEGRLSKTDLGLFSDENEAALNRVISFCRRYGDAKLGIQLYHGGRKSSISTAWEGQKAIPLDKGGWTPHSASDVAYPGRNNPQALDEAGIRREIGAFAKAAERANRIGFDMIEIHAAHGYLIHNFLSPFANKRTDGYGGSLQGRMRFAIEIYEAIRKVWPDHKPLGMRISATDWVEGGWTLDDSVELAKELKKRGCDYITASSGGSVPEQQLNVGPGYQVPFAERIRTESGMATMAVGLITEARQAEDIIASGKADMVALGRGMLFNPRWPWHAAMELGQRVYYPPQYERSHPQMRAGDFLKPRAEA